jgi:hypothetical protein
MKPKEVFDILHGVGATHLHHANSVTTSSTFLEQGGLLSRGFVEDHGLTQTAQSSDEKDKRYAIWHLLFLDHVDIHERGGRKKGGNLYGPVLFKFDIVLLLELPEDAEIFVTKRNPVHWFDSQPDAERCFTTPEELAPQIRFGDFDKMLMIRTAAEQLDFRKGQALIVLDDPQRTLPSGEDAYRHAESRLRQAAGIGHITSSIQPRVCRSGCICTEKYAKYTEGEMNFWFT